MKSINITRFTKIKIAGLAALALAALTSSAAVGLVLVLPLLTLRLEYPLTM